MLGAMNAPRSDKDPRAAAVDRRAAAIRQADTSLALEGLSPSATGRPAHDQWVQGEVSGDEAVARILQAHRVKQE